MKKICLLFIFCLCFAYEHAPKKLNENFENYWLRAIKKFTTYEEFIKYRNIQICKSDKEFCEIIKNDTDFLHFTEEKNKQLLKEIKEREIIDNQEFINYYNNLEEKIFSEIEPFLKQFAENEKEEIIKEIYENIQLILDLKYYEKSNENFFINFINSKYYQIDLDFTDITIKIIESNSYEELLKYLKKQKIELEQIIQKILDDIE